MGSLIYEFREYDPFCARGQHSIHKTEVEHHLLEKFLLHSGVHSPKSTSQFDNWFLQDFLTFAIRKEGKLVNKSIKTINIYLAQHLLNKVNTTKIAFIVVM